MKALKALFGHIHAYLPDLVHMYDMSVYLLVFYPLFRMRMILHSWVAFAELLLLRTFGTSCKGCIMQRSAIWGTRKHWQRYIFIMQPSCPTHYAVDIGLEMSVNTVLYYLAQVASCSECLPRSVVQHFVNLCEVCSLQRPQRNQAPLKPIISSGFMTRGQVCNVTCCPLYNNCYLLGAT